MDTRTAGALIGILLTVCLGLVLSAVYPFTTAEPRAASPPDERFTVNTTAGYSATGSIVVDGDVRLAFEGVVTTGGAWYQKVVWGEEVTSERYGPTANGTVYQRLTIEGSDRAERRRRAINEDEDRVLVRQDRDGDHVTFVVEQNATGASDPVSGAASTLVRSLSFARYEAGGTDVPGVTVYEPQAGWYERGQTYRIAGASGAIRVDAETRAVKSANVSWDVTEPAGTYAEYALVRLTTDAPTTQRITFERVPDDDLERPAWVDETGSE